VALNGPIRGWNAAPGHGVNPGTFGGPFTDNGSIPNGLQAAFLQQNGVLSQVVTDFTVGALYQLRYFENARNCCSAAPPFLEVQVGGAMVVAPHAVSPVGGTNAYREVISHPFIATTTAMEVAFIKSSPEDGDNTILLDDVKFFQGPTLLQQPLSQTNPTGASVTFTVQAVGAQPFSYQWRLNGVNIPFATDPSFTIGGAEVNSGGSYSVLVSNPYGVALSSPALLQLANVDTAPPALSDSFAGRGDLALNLARRIQGNNCGATRETGEPFHAGRVGHHSVWYRWHADSDGIATFRTRGSAFDTLLAVYTGATLNTLRFVASDDDSGGFHTSQVQFNAVAGVEYAIALDGKGDDCGLFMLTWSFEVTSQLLPFITSQPQSRSVLLGQQHVLAVTASGQNLYQWYFNGSPIAGATEAQFVRARVRPEDVGYYFVRVTEQNTGRIVDSRTAILELGPVPAVQSVARPEDSFFGTEFGSGGGDGAENGGGGGGGAQAMFQPASVSAPTGGLGIPVPRGGVGRQIWSSTQGSTAIAQCGVAPTATRWLLLSNATEGFLVIHTEGSRTTAGQPMKSVATVYRQDVTGLPIYVPQVACAVANDPTRTYAVVRFFAQANTGYWIAADGVSSSGLLQLNWVHSPWPIRMQPVEQLTVPVGRSVNLGVNVQWNVGPDAVEPPSLFRWTLNQQPPFLTPWAVRKFTNVQPTDAGRYSVTASNIAVWTNLFVTLQVESSLQTLTESTFDALDSEGWTLGPALTLSNGPAPNGSGKEATALWAPDFHCGYLRYETPATSWLAPPKFRGNQSAAYGGFFEFALRQSQVTVLLRGAGLSLQFQSNLIPPSTGLWANYRIPLTANGWTVNGRQATELELMQALAALTSLEILTPAPTFAGGGDLDDVALVGPVVDTVPYLVIRTLPGGLARLEWPFPARSLVLEEGASTTDPRSPIHWLPVAFPYVTNAFYISVNVPLVSGGRMYRLHRP
jgi:hypothetical protein